MPREIYTYKPHPHIESRKARAPRVPVARKTGPMERFNTYLAVKITNGVGTMWCAYAFAALALISLPQAVHGGVSTLIAWIAQTFLQLVLLSIIIVGQKVSSVASDSQARRTYEDAEAILHEAMQIQHHLIAQDEVLKGLIQNLGGPKEGDQG
jgi:hypothetical protein